MFEGSETNNFNQRFNITTVFFHFQVGRTLSKQLLADGGSTTLNMHESLV